MDVLIAAGGAGWEAAAVRVLETSRRRRLARRCVDVADLLAAAEAGLGDVALVDAGLAGLDADCVHRLGRAGVAVVPLGLSDRSVGLGLGAPAEVEHLEARLDEVGAEAPEPGAAPAAPAPSAEGAVLVVWGPVGAPGRTTVATNVAGEAAALGRRVLLVDADPSGGAVGQTLGLLEDVSGLLAASRAANAGESDAIERHAYLVADRFAVLTGLPRADLWPHVRPGAFEQVLQQARSAFDLVVVDAGSSLDELGAPDSGAPRRHQLTRQSIEHADLLLVCGLADPVGLGRLVRGVHALDDGAPGLPRVVVVNRMRPSLGWSAPEVGHTLRRLCGTAPDAFLPADVDAADKALVSGSLLRAAAPQSRLTGAIAALARTCLARLEPAADATVQPAARHAARM